MPDWQPNWEDVRWSQGAAGATAGALRQTAAELDRAADERGRARWEAMEQWLGAYRELFEAQQSRGLADLRELAERCRRAAAQIEAASARAREEQAHREREREDWERECEREREREANRV